MRRIKIEIAPNGETKVDALGFTGSNCVEATAFLRQLGSVQQEDIKPEYYNTPLLTEGVYNDG